MKINNYYDYNLVKKYECLRRECGGRLEKDLSVFVSEVSTNFKRGTTERLRLALLTQKDWYVYELSKVLKEMSKGLFDIQGSSMYMALYRMEARGFVSTYTEKSKNTCVLPSFAARK